MSKQVVAPAVADLLSLNGQRALVTGASGNIGHGIAVRLAEAGADIIGTSSGVKIVEEVMDEISKPATP